MIKGNEYFNSAYFNFNNEPMYQACTNPSTIYCTWNSENPADTLSHITRPITDVIWLIGFDLAAVIMIAFIFIDISRNYLTKRSAEPSITNHDDIDM